MEELQARHRKEQRDLQSRITQKKKQASKKTRKGVNDECEALEAELGARQADEISALNGNVEGQDVEATADQRDNDDDPSSRKPEGDDELNNNGIYHHDTQQTNGTIAPAEPYEDEPGTGGGKIKRNRQKERLARRAAEQEEQSRLAAEEAKNLPNMKQQERERMLASMRERGLTEKEIRADGHCLYSAVADQLDQLQIPLSSAPDDKPYRIVRTAAAEYIETHGDDFTPFLEEPLADYVHKVRDTGEWGGQMELMALARRYGVEINVLQDFGRVESIESEAKVGGQEEKKAMWLGYYKHGFGLGEHYNSLRKAG